MFNPSDVLTDLAETIATISSSCKGRVKPRIQAEFDDENTDIWLGLTRWADRKYTQAPGFGPIWRD